MNHYSIAIDGPAASGKSTAAKGVSKALGFLYVDTGAMYRAFTLQMIRLGLDTKSPEDAHKALAGFRLKEDREGKIYLNGEDVTSRVREMDVSSQVSYACAHPEVRTKLVALQQQMATEDSVVMDGRDIGTVVLPNATLKIYMVASVEARAERRFAENKERGITSTYEDILKDIQGRDYLDSHRKTSPLRQSPDAILLDTSNLSIPEVIDKILKLFNEKRGQ